MKIEIHNKTHWRSDHIRAFVRRILPNERAALCGRSAPTLLVRVVYNRGGNRHTYVTGCATYYSNRITLKLASGQVDRIDLAHTVAHELAHTRGVRHSEMSGDPAYTRTGNWRELYAWAETLPLEQVEKKSIVKSIEQKVSHVQGMLKKAMSRERRAKTIRQKWERKLRYLETKVLSVAAKNPEKKGELQFLATRSRHQRLNSRPTRRILICSLTRFARLALK